jgi:DNA polymerase (family 10)
VKSELTLEEAKNISNKFVEEFLKDITEKVEVCGSIRRERPEVGDIDIVCIPKNRFHVVGQILRKLPKPSKIIKDGDKLIQIEYEGVQVDIYLANKNTFETIKLIRTGSANHNIKLCSLAKEKCWHLYADGRGLVDCDEKLISNTEEGILKNLLGKWVEPKEREWF